MWTLNLAAAILGAVACGCKITDKDYGIAVAYGFLSAVNVLAMLMTMGG
jgi:hypothetical protein